MCKKANLDIYIYQFIVKGIAMASSPSNQTKIVNVRNQALDGEIQFCLWSHPKFEAGNKPLSLTNLTNHPNVTTVANACIGNLNSNQGPCYFSGYNSYSLANSNNFYCKEYATDTGKRWADQFELNGLFYDENDKTKQFGENASRYAGGIFAQNWGSHIGHSSVHHMLMADKDDLVWYKDAATGGQIGFPAGFHKNSCKKIGNIAEIEKLSNDTTLSLADFILWAAHTMKKECDARKLCYPKMLTWDWEGHVGTYFSADSNNNQGALIGAEGVRSNSPAFTLGNAFDLVMEDPRFATEVVYEDWDGKQWIGKTLFDAYTEAGFNKLKNKGYTAGDKARKIYWFQDINREFCRAMEPYFQRINDHALNAALYEPMKQVFPDIITGNYNIYHGISKAAKNQHFEVRNIWARTPKNDWNNKKYLHADYQCPVCYSVDMSQYKYTVNTFQEASVIDASSVGHIYYWNAHCLGKTSQEIYNNCMIQYVRNCTASSATNEKGNVTACIPWIEPPHEKVGGSEGVGVHDASYNDILTILKAHYNLGVRRWLVFNPYSTQDYYGVNGSPGITPQERVKEFTQLIEEFVAWTKVQKQAAAIDATVTVTKATTVAELDA